MSEFTPLEERIKNLTVGLLGMVDGQKILVNKAFLEHVRDDMAELLTLRRAAKPANEPLTQPEDQWMETASDNTDCVLAYADGIYCMTDADGHVICEFIRNPPEGRENDGPTI